MTTERNDGDKDPTPTCPRCYGELRVAELMREGVLVRRFVCDSCDYESDAAHLIRY